MKLKTILQSKPTGYVAVGNMNLIKRREDILERDVGAMMPLPEPLETKRSAALRSLLLDLYPNRV
jgi:hypothetical protein